MNGPKYKPGERLSVVVYRNESNFDKACDMAVRIAVGMFGIDEAGHIHHVEGADRSRSYLVLEFRTVRISASMGGWGFDYQFDAWVEVNNE